MFWALKSDPDANIAEKQLSPKSFFIVFLEKDKLMSPTSMNNA